jgi:hypothetical protein
MVSLYSRVVRMKSVRSLDHVPLALIFIYLLTLFVYLANGRSIAFVDTGPARHLALSILRDHDLDLDEVKPYLPVLELDYVTKEVNGKLISYYPVGTPFLAAPFYLAGMAAGLSPDQYDGLAKLEKWAAANIGALLSVLFWVLLRRRTHARFSVRLLLWIAFVFGSSNWIVNSQGLWQHSPLQIFEILALLALPRNLALTRNYWRVAACGLLLGLAGFMRPTGYVLIPVWGLYLLWKNWRFALPFAAGVIVGGLPQILYNLAYVPRGDGGYFQLIFGNDYFKDLHPVHNCFALLFNPSRGIVIFSPYVLLLGLWGFAAVRRRAALEIPRLLLAGSALAIFSIYLGFQIWWQGWCYGARFLSDILPFLFLLMVPPLEYLVSARRLVAVPGVAFTVLCIVWAVGVQALGAVRYDGGWDGRVQLAGYWDIAWDWEDNIIRDAWNGNADPRAQVQSPGYYTVEPGRIYRMGLRESRQYLFSGFYDQEGWGTWTRGVQPAVMRLHFPQGPGKLYLAAMGTGSDYAPARFDIELNGRRVKKARIHHNSFITWKKELIEIPLKKNRLTGGVERLTIISHDGRRAAPTGRIYGMGIKEMLYVPAAAQDTATSKIVEMMAIP